jgi:hypothetical protein
MTSEHEARALIERLREDTFDDRDGATVGKSHVELNHERHVAATTLEALLAERDQDEAQLELARVRAYQAGVSAGADAERDLVVEWLMNPAETGLIERDVRIANALARNAHRNKDDGQ